MSHFCIDCGKPMNPVQVLLSASSGRCGPCIRGIRPLHVSFEPSVEQVRERLACLIEET